MIYRIIRIRETIVYQEEMTLIEAEEQIKLFNDRDTSDKFRLEEVKEDD